MADQLASPSFLEDPITLELMEEAMVAPCGHSYSKDSITRWLADKQFCPLCKVTLTSDRLLPNYALRDAVDNYKAQNGVKSSVVDRRGLDIKNPMNEWTVEETQRWIESFPDWVEDSVLVSEHGINGAQLEIMTTSEIKDKLSMENDEHVSLLMAKIENVKALSKHLHNAAVYEQQPVYQKPTPLAMNTSSTSSGPSRPHIDVEQGHDEMGCFDHARESESGCCAFECTDCFLCECSEGWYKCCTYKKYRSPAALFCESCGGKKATYSRRTFWGICFIPFVMVILLLLAVEGFLWFVLIVCCLLASVFVLIILVAMAGGR